MNKLETALELRQLRALIGKIYSGVKDAPYLHKVLKDIGGGTDAALMLEGLIYWDARMRTHDGYWYKDLKSWEEQAGLSRRQVEKAEKALEERGLIDRDVRRVDQRTWGVRHYRLNWGAFWQAFAQAVKKSLEFISDCVRAFRADQNEQHEMRESSSTRCANRAAQAAHFVQRALRKVSNNNVLDSTSESTLDSTSDPQPGAPAHTPVVVGAQPDGIDPQIKQDWETTLNQLEMQIDRASFNAWLRGSRVIRVEGDGWTVGVRSEQARDMLQRRLHTTISRTMDNFVRGGVTLAFEVVEQPEARLLPAVQSGPVQSPAERAIDLYEQHIGSIDDREAVGALAEVYPLEHIEAAFVNTKLQNSGGKVRDPLAYAEGILKRTARPGLRVINGGFGGQVAAR